MFFEYGLFQIRFLWSQTPTDNIPITAPLAIRAFPIPNRSARKPTAGARMAISRVLIWDSAESPEAMVRWEIFSLR